MFRRLFPPFMGHFKTYAPFTSERSLSTFTRIIGVEKIPQSPQEIAKRQQELGCIRTYFSSKKIGAYDAFLERLYSAQAYHTYSHVHVIEHVVWMLKKEGNIDALVCFNTNELFAYFFLAKFQVSPDAFNSHKDLFITPEKEYRYAGGIGGHVMNRFMPALKACTHLLKIGFTFEEAVQEIQEIAKLPDADARFHIMDTLPLKYVKSWKHSKIELCSSSFCDDRSIFSSKKDFLQKITMLQLPTECDIFRLKEVIEHLLKHEKLSWKKVVKTISPKPMSEESHRDYINNILYSRIFRRAAQKELSLPPNLLDDSCTWFDNKVDIKALKSLIHQQATPPDIAVLLLAQCNAFQKWIIAVGGNYKEAVEIYGARVYKNFHPIVLDNGDRFRAELLKYRQNKNVDTPQAHAPIPISLFSKSTGKRALGEEQAKEDINTVSLTSTGKNQRN